MAGETSIQNNMNTLAGTDKLTTQNAAEHQADYTPNVPISDCIVEIVNISNYGMQMALNEYINDGTFYSTQEALKVIGQVLDYNDLIDVNDNPIIDVNDLNIVVYANYYLIDVNDNNIVDVNNNLFVVV